MLLSHAAGSTQLPGYTDLLDLDGNGFDQYDEIARRLAAAAPDWEPGTAHGSGPDLFTEEGGPWSEHAANVFELNIPPCGAKL